MARHGRMQVLVNETSGEDMTVRTSMDVIENTSRICRELEERPIRLRDVRAKATEVEEFARRVLFLRSVLSEVSRVVTIYYPLPESIAFYRRRQEVYRWHVERGDLDGSHDRNVLIGSIHGLCSWWLNPALRYHYGDPRLLRPLIGEVLVQAAEWPRSPYPDMHAQLGEWYEALAPDGALYPDDAHLEYVRRFEDFAEEIIWDSRGQERLTIVNFPAPPGAGPPSDDWSTQHLST